MESHPEEFKLKIDPSSLQLHGRGSRWQQLIAHLIHRVEQEGSSPPALAMLPIEDCRVLYDKLMEINGAAFTEYVSSALLTGENPIFRGEIKTGVTPPGFNPSIYGIQGDQLDLFMAQLRDAQAKIEKEARPRGGVK